MDRDRKTRVLIVATSPEIIGGQSIQARRLLEAFDGDEAIELAFLPNDPATPFRRIKYLRTILASLRFWFSLVLKIPQFDVVHVFSSAMTGYVIATLPPLLIARIFGVSSVLNYHSGELREHIEHWPATALPSMRRFDRIVVPSRFLAEIFAENGLEAAVIPNFVDTERFAFREREMLRPMFLSNRNLEAHYNVGDCLRAFQLIQDRVPGASLIVAGSGSEEESLKSLALELDLRNVEFVGRIAPDEMPQIHLKADIYLNSSVVDNMPLSFIEAFSSGLPVVSYATGGIPYIVKDRETGMLAEQGNVEELAARAVELLEDRELARSIVANARAEVSKYSFESVRSDWVNFYTCREEA